MQTVLDVSPSESRQSACSGPVGEPETKDHHLTLDDIIEACKGWAENPEISLPQRLLAMQGVHEAKALQQTSHPSTSAMASIEERFCAICRHCCPVACAKPGVITRENCLLTG